MACCEKVNALVIHRVDEAMFMVDPARPAAGQLSPELLGLSRSVEWIPNGRFDEPEHAERQPAVSSCPVFEVLEAMTVENDLASPCPSIHVLSSPRRARRSPRLVGFPPPSPARAAASRSRLAFFGERNR